MCSLVFTLNSTTLREDSFLIFFLHFFIIVMFYSSGQFAICYQFYIGAIRNLYSEPILGPRDRRSGAYCFFPVCHSVILSYAFCHSLWNFNLANNFWTVNARGLIFHMSWSCDKTFPWVPLFLTLWPWPSSLIHF